MGTLFTDKGEIVVSLRGVNGGASPPPTSLPPISNMSLFSPAGGRLEGVHLLEEDARRLMSTYGADYADRGALEHGFIVFDVMASASIPPSRWVFSTRASYLALDPVSDTQRTPNHRLPISGRAPCDERA
jgi:hypothetical protein